MICLNIRLKSTETIIQLYYKKWDDAEKASINMLTMGESIFRDDYGQYARVNSAEVAAAVVTDMHRYFEAQTEIGVMQQKAQQEAQKKAMGPGGLMMPKRPMFNG